MLTLEIPLRSLRRSPALAAAAIATLVFGIGVSAAIFSVLNAVLVRPLPYGEADCLAVITQDLRTRSAREVAIASADVADIRDRSTLFEGVAAVQTDPAITI